MFIHCVGECVEWLDKVHFSRNPPGVVHPIVNRFKDIFHVQISHGRHYTIARS